MFDGKHYEANRHGSARWASVDELRKAGYLDGRDPLALQLGFAFDRKGRAHAISNASDASLVSFGGAGTGKYASVGLAAGLQYRSNIVSVDPKSEWRAQSEVADAHLGKDAYYIDARGGDMADPLEILEPGPDLMGDCQMLAAGLTPHGGGSDRFWNDVPKGWTAAFLYTDVMTNGRTSLPRIYRIVQAVNDPERFRPFLEAMAAMPNEEVVRCAHQIGSLQAEGGRLWESFCAELFRHWSFMADDRLRHALEQPSFSWRKIITSRERNFSAYLCFAPDSFERLAPFIRTTLEGAALIAMRDVGGPRLVLNVDEAGSLASGSWDGLTRLYTLGRGFGVRVWSWFQDTAQVRKALGDTALQTILASSGVRQFLLPIRDYDSAAYLSNAIGSGSLRTENRLVAEQARHDLREKSLQLLRGENPLQTLRELEHLKKREVDVHWQSRPLATAAELMADPQEGPARQILFMDGLPGPVAGVRIPYWKDKRLNGRWFPHPAFPPGDRVKLPGRFFSKWAKVKSAPVPKRLAHSHQYRSGQPFRFIEGFKP